MQILIDTATLTGIKPHLGKLGRGQKEHGNLANLMTSMRCT